MKKLCVILCSAPDIESGRHIAEVLLEHKLAACISIAPGVESHYVWEGKTERSQEVLLWIKTTEECYPEAEEAILDTHPYDCPEILQMPITRGFGEYMEWAEEQVS